eukprot:200308-Prorocentrum_lima.AAC.1
MHPNLGSPRSIAGSGVIDEVGGNKSAPRASPSTLLDTDEREITLRKSRRKQENARRVKGVGAAKRSDVVRKQAKAQTRRRRRRQA